jgi:MFS transporter, DHA2 family, multidrug resistance protein
MLMSQGMSAANATQMAMGQAYQQMLRQASMLSYKNAFTILAGTIFLLTPLPFIMRLPTKAAKPRPEDMGH